MTPLALSAIGMGATSKTTTGSGTPLAGSDGASRYAENLYVADALTLTAAKKGSGIAGAASGAPVVIVQSTSLESAAPPRQKSAADAFEPVIDVDCVV